MDPVVPTMKCSNLSQVQLSSKEQVCSASLLVTTSSTWLTTDHNIHTIDGLHTFYGMGMITAVSPAQRATSHVQWISVTETDIAAMAHVNIKTFSAPCGVETL